MVKINVEEETIARKKQWQYQPQPDTSALPEVRLRKKSAPNAPLDYMTQRGIVVCSHNGLYSSLAELQWDVKHVSFEFVCL